MTILIAEDEQDIRNLLKIQLEQEGYSVIAAADGALAFAEFQKGGIDLVLLDVMMPGLDGFNLLRKIRKDSTVPALFLTARGDEMDKLLGLGIGADDYIVKPYSSAELLARVGALLRRSGEYAAPKKNTQSRIDSGDLSLDLAACCVYKAGDVVELNAKEYLLLQYLMENPRRVFTKKQLYKAVWDEDIYYDDNTVMVHISRLRTKIESDPKNPEHIRTIRGIGYKFQSAEGAGHEK